MKTNNQPKTYKVLLTLFQDDATGDWGLAHDNGIDRDFNAFWTGQGIFHDVFEHYFEGINKYFTGKHGFNIGGEICAMGHLAYYWETFRPENRPLNKNSYYSMENSIAHTTIDDMKESIMEGYSNFGSRLESAVPKQKGVNSYMLDSIISEHQYCMETCEVKENADEKESAEVFKRSITPNKIENLYLYGYKLAQKIAPYSEDNRTTLEGFIDYWNDFCRTHEAEMLRVYFKHLEFTITKGENLKWTADFITHNGGRVNYNEVAEFYYA